MIRIASALIALAIVASAGDVSAQPPAGRDPAPQREKQDPAVLLRRIADLEVQVAALTKELQITRDAKALKDLNELNVFTLKKTKAADIAKILLELYPEKGGETFRVAVDAGINTVIVRCPRERMDAVEALIHRLESQRADTPEKQKQ